MESSIRREARLGTSTYENISALDHRGGHAGTAIASCFHCGLTVPPHGGFGVEADGAWRPVCCAGCEAVAATILGQGLGDYYRLRTSTAASARDDTGHDELEIFDDPRVQKAFVRTSNGHAEALLLLEGIRCAACVWLNEQLIARIPGVVSSSVNYVTHCLSLHWDPGRVLLSEVLRVIRSIGYRAHPYDPGRADVLQRGERHDALWRLFVAGLGMMQVMMYAIPAYLSSGDMTHDIEQLLRWASLILTVPVLLYSAAPFFSGAARDLRLGKTGMDVPIALGIGIAFLASVAATVTADGPVYFDSITMFVCALLAGRYLELSARQRAARSVQYLGRLVPKSAYRLTNYPESLETEVIPAIALRPGERVMITPGDAIPADAVVEKGVSKVSEALLTGESSPADKRAGDSLLEGAVNISNTLIARITSTGADTVLSGIVRMIERAASDRPEFAEIAERAAGLFVAFVLGLAILAAAYWLAIAPEKALWVTVSVLVATCPCAFSLATPVALTAATGAFARHGLIPMRGRAIGALARVTDLVFDKTGTLTQGVVRLIALRVQGRVQAGECLRIAAALEASSRHPIAVALTTAARDAGISVDAAEAATAWVGSGIEARLNGYRYRIGAPAFVAELAAGSSDGDSVEMRDADEVWLGDECGPLAAMRFGDELRSEAPEALAELARLGLKLHLVTGDGAEQATRIARQLGIDRVSARVLPQGKLDYVRALQQQGAVVAVVGDGVNDAPVLARSDLSIAMGDGTRLAQLQADAILGSGNLTALAWSVVQARKTRSIIRQNLVWAFVYNLVVIPLAFGGAITPWAAALGMSASSLLVIVNALRLVDPGRALRSPRAFADVKT
ncbi:MAG: heavy metal translocating P-type ATPase [Betaproteobacteria bacterium]|nr:heavy metal translocating P-type ATPase [Betaproteobacteria bacterium]